MKINAIFAAKANPEGPDKTHSKQILNQVKRKPPIKAAAIKKPPMIRFKSLWFG